MKPTIAYQDDLVTLWHGRCEDVLPTLDQVDHVICDPPYSEHVHGKSMRGASQYDPSYNKKGTFAAEFARPQELGFDALTPECRTFCAGEFARLALRWVLVFSDVESCHLWRDALVSASLEYVRTGEWRKINGAPQFTGDRPGIGFETITIVHPKGRKVWNGGGAPASWEYPVVKNRSGKDPRLHTTQKPLALMRRLVSLFTDEGETILDPFAGSGTTLLAARSLGRKAIGVEMSEEYCEVIAKRLSEQRMQGVFDLEVSV
jgi:tRNA G10  N-methylase Trm11